MMLNVIMQNDIMLNVATLNAIILHVILPVVIYKRHFAECPVLCHYTEWVGFCLIKNI
jgi:hypothetical protein